MKAGVRSANWLTEILQVYSEGSRQRVNKQKSSVLFSANSGASVWVGVRNALDIHREAPTKKYLGLSTPSVGSRSNTLSTFMSAQDVECKAGVTKSFHVHLRMFFLKQWFRLYQPML